VVKQFTHIRRKRLRVFTVYLEKVVGSRGDCLSVHIAGQLWQHLLDVVIQRDHDLSRLTLVQYHTEIVLNLSSANGQWCLFPEHFVDVPENTRDNNGIFMGNLEIIPMPFVVGMGMIEHYFPSITSLATHQT
jgi:hypothetical protein